MPLQPNSRQSRSAFYRRLRQLGFKSYDEYLRSPHWKNTKQRFRADERPQDCYCCGEWEDTHLHHRTYERLGAELLDDLVPLCPRCHSLVHVLERRGDLALDLTGLLDQARAARYAKQQRSIVERAAADNAAKYRTTRYKRVCSLATRLKEASRTKDLDALRQTINEVKIIEDEMRAEAA